MTDDKSGRHAIKHDTTIDISAVNNHDKDITEDGVGLIDSVIANAVPFVNKTVPHNPKGTCSTFSRNIAKLSLT